MRIGDILEWLAVACLAGAALTLGGLAPTLLVLGVALFYFGQCYGGSPLPVPKRPKLRRRKRADTG